MHIPCFSAGFAAAKTPSANLKLPRDLSPPSTAKKPSRSKQPPPPSVAKAKGDAGELEARETGDEHALFSRKALHHRPKPGEPWVCQRSLTSFPLARSSLFRF